jgi:hypothetical protein
MGSVNMLQALILSPRYYKGKNIMSYKITNCQQASNYIAIKDKYYESSGRFHRFFR